MSIMKINLLPRSAQFLDRQRSEFEECGAKVGTLGAKLDSDLLLFIPAYLSV